MTGFTPGPWSVPHFATEHRCNCQYVLSDNQHGMGAIATVHHSQEGGDGSNENEPLEVAIANARLIAAAPELFEALEKIDNEAPARESPDRPTVGFQPSADPEVDDGNEVVREAFDEGVCRGLSIAAGIARAALAKARGETR